MTRILIVNGNSRELIVRGHPDYVQTFSEVLYALDAGLTLQGINPDDMRLTERDLEGVEAVIFTGSSSLFAADAPKTKVHRDAMEQVFSLGLPVWGSCNGLQLAAAVLGGRVGASANGVEIGLASNLTLTGQGAAHAMMAGRSAVFASCTIHRDEVLALPQGADLLVTNDHSPVQAFAVGTGGVDFWGTQYHPEIAPPMIARSLRQRDGDRTLAADLDRVETDPDAAARLGTTPDALRLDTRAIELRNWLLHVRRRAQGPQHDAVQELAPL
jgi:GMP synthase (glutamine-hydrolysing)